MKGAIERLGEVIGYPERVPEGAVSYVFRVDDDPVRVRLSGARIILEWRFPEGVPVERLAGFATGRILREEATLAWEPSVERALLWQPIPQDADGGELERSVGAFLNSRDWWKERVREFSAPKPKMADLVFRP